MAAECATFAIHRMAHLLDVSTSGFYKHQGRSARTQLNERKQRRVDLEVKILSIHRESRGVYGAPRITAKLHGRGEIVTEKTVAKLMRALGIAGISPRTFKIRTTVVDPSATFPCGEGDMYLCAFKDEHSKKVLGWAVAEHMRTELVLEALEMAVAARGGDVAGTIVHSDRGSQYTAEAMRQACERHGLRRSMGATGICWDNAGAESLWSTFKHEYYYRHTFVYATELIAAVDNWMSFYNTQRRHSSIGMLSPTNYEQSLNAPVMAA